MAIAGCCAWITNKIRRMGDIVMVDADYMNDRIQRQRQDLANRVPRAAAPLSFPDHVEVPRRTTHSQNDMFSIRSASIRLPSERYPISDIGPSNPRSTR